MLTLQEIISSTDAKLILSGCDCDSSTFVLKGVSTDTRTIKKNDIFVAIKGPNFDGHQFISQAIRAGAKAVVVSKRVATKCDVPLLKVLDTTEALGLMARCYRQKFSIPVIAITGSAGKTTTKDMIGLVLSQKYKVLKNVKTENNQYGVPLTLFKLKKSHEVIVLELGTNQKGDIAWLAKICQPTVAVFTNIGESHLAGLKNAYGVFCEKAQLIKGMSKGTVIFNKDDPYLSKLSLRAKGLKKLSYSLKSRSNLQAKNILSNQQKLSFSVGRNHFQLNTLAKHNIANALAAISCGRLFNISYNNINKALKKKPFDQGRQQLKRISGMWVIDDTYNCNPVSLVSAIQSLTDFENKGRKILVCSDMLELGPKSIELHQSMGRLIGRSSIDCCVTTGQASKHISSALRRSNSTIENHHYTSQEDVQSFLKKFCQAGDALLVKGSRGMRMERVVNSLK